MLAGARLNGARRAATIIRCRNGENRLRVLFAGARVRGRGRATRWDGSLKAEGARILGAETVGFIENRDRIVGVRPVAGQSFALRRLDCSPPPLL